VECQADQEQLASLVGQDNEVGQVQLDHQAAGPVAPPASPAYLVSVRLF